jgi:aldehyde dehydrogenase (NAD+)
MSKFSFPAPVVNAGKSADKSAVRRILELPGLEYGPAPEDTKVVNAWLEDHGRSFGHFINNKWHKPEGRAFYETKNPSTGEVLCKTIQGNQDDCNYAVQSAREAYGSWSKLTPHARARHLYSIARHLQKHMRIVACIESMDNGKPIRESRDADIPAVVRHIYHHAGWAQLMETEMREWAPVVINPAHTIPDVACIMLPRSV